MNPRFTQFTIAALFLLLALWGCEKAPRAPGSEEGEKASISFDGFKARGTRLGKLIWEAEARTAQVYAQRKAARAQEVRIRYLQDGRLASLATAREAELGTESHDIQAWGDVVVRSQNGVVLYAQRLNWDNRRQRLSSDGPVKVVRKDSVLTGRGLVADRDLQDVTVREDVSISAPSVNSLREQAEELRRQGVQP